MKALSKERVKAVMQDAANIIDESIYKKHGFKARSVSVRWWNGLTGQQQAFVERSTATTPEIKAFFADVKKHFGKQAHYFPYPHFVVAIIANGQMHKWNGSESKGFTLCD